MITHILKGGEFYAESACRRGAPGAERWNSSVEQLQSVGAITAISARTIPVQVAARISIHPGISFALAIPHPVLNILTMNKLKLHIM